MTMIADDTHTHTSLLCCTLLIWSLIIHNLSLKPGFQGGREGGCSLGRWRRRRDAGGGGGVDGETSSSALLSSDNRRCKRQVR